MLPGSDGKVYCLGNLFSKLNPSLDEALSMKSMSSDCVTTEAFCLAYAELLSISHDGPSLLWKTRSQVHTNSEPSRLPLSAPYYGHCNTFALNGGASNKCHTNSSSVHKMTPHRYKLQNATSPSLTLFPLHNPTSWTTFLHHTVATCLSPFLEILTQTFVFFEGSNPASQIIYRTYLPETNSLISFGSFQLKFLWTD